MDRRHASIRGCLLGMAVGDAMGHTVNSLSWDQIREDYGPNGLLGYDLVNGYADATSYTQLAAFTCCGLLLGLTRGQLRGRMAPFIRYISLAVREWAQSQRYHAVPGRTYCWVYQVPELRRHFCVDTFMLDTLSREKLGTPEEPANRLTGPGSLTTAISIGLFYSPERITRQEIDRLGAEAVALSHGGQTAFLSGAVLAHMVTELLCNPDEAPEAVVRGALDAVEELFGGAYYQMRQVRSIVEEAIALADNPDCAQPEAMERLECTTAAQVLAGAVYAWLVSGGDFDTAMIVSVNHSGKSAAVGAVTGALMGAVLGEAALPDFYIECLEPADTLRELADDLAQGCPMVAEDALFDCEWDRKYIYGGV